MTTDKPMVPRLVELWYEGRDYWYHYQHFVPKNDYHWEPKEETLKLVARNLDINVKHLRHCINLFLEN